MELNEALSKIKNYSEMKQVEQESEEQRKINQFNSLKKTILSFCDKMVELNSIVNALAENKIRNGKFFTDGINHELGFYGNLLVQRSQWPWGEENTLLSKGLFGIEGGGCCGGDLIIDIFNKTLRYTREGKELEYNCIIKMKNIVKKFDDYYKSVYNYVENLK